MTRGTVSRVFALLLAVGKTLAAAQRVAAAQRAGPQEIGDRRIDGRHGAEQIGLDGALRIGERSLSDHLSVADSGIGDHDVYATELAGSLAKNARYRLVVSNVELAREDSRCCPPRGARERFHLTFERLEAVEPSRGDHDRVTRCGKLEGERTADPGGGTGNENGSVCVRLHINLILSDPIRSCISLRAQLPCAAEDAGVHTVIPVASGKGGVGKSLFSTNLGVSLAQAGKTVLLVDLDLGGSNLHTCLGIRNSNPGIGHYIHKRADSLEQLIVETSQKKLFFIPGDSLLPATANLPYFRKVKMLREMRNLVADYIILDLGAGTAHNTVDFFLAAAGGILVCTPETTSILNAYSFLKSVCYRTLYRSFAPDSRERTTIHDFMTERIESSDSTLSTLVSELTQIDAHSGTLARTALDTLIPRVVLNMGRSSRDIAIGAKLREIARKNLDVEVEYIGFLPWDERLGASVVARTPVSLSHPDIPYVRNMHTIAGRLIARPVPKRPHLFEDDADLSLLNEQVPD